MATLLRATLIGDLYGRDHYGEIAGVVSAFALGARAAAPFAAAFHRAAAGAYTTLVALLALMSVASAASVMHGAAGSRNRLRTAAADASAGIA